ncbi:GAF domain-containing protein [Pseudonocardia aurantiaca]|uniref:histidine kinase n=1 Tax=Pseudonocardia aurantiaca TaxID=75290 RepID=A0ABW4FP31_9PSEU
MALILAVAVAGFIVARTLAERDVQRDSERRAEVAAAQIHGRIAQAASLTESLRRFMLDASGVGVTSDQFARNAFRWLSPADFPAAAWAEPLPDSQRAAYERRIGQPIVTPDDGHSVVPGGSRSSYLAATLVSGFPPLALPGIDLGGEPGMAAALDRATDLDGVTATPVAGPDTGTNGLFLVAPAPNLVGESLRPGYVVVFVPDLTLSAAADTPGLQLAVGGTVTGGPPAGEQTVRTSFTEAGQQFDVILPRGPVHGAATALPWIILACGLVLAGLAPVLGINAARRARAQNELDRIFNLSPDLITVANFERHFTRVNPAAEQILGYTQDELLERPFLDFVHPDDRERTAAESAAIGQGKTAISFENRYVRKDGSYRVLEWTTTPVVEESVMYGVARDVTERRRAEIELERLAGEQAALRRVATLVADGARPEEVFAAVATEVGRLLEVEVAVLNRYDPQDMITVVGMWTSTGATGATPVGSRLPLGGQNVTTLVCRTGRSARIDYADVSGAIGEIAIRDWGPCSSVGVPVSVEGRLWGVMDVALTRDELLPAGAEARLAGFTELIATAVANAQARVELRRFADEQAALRRVATLVARGTRPEEVFAAVTAEAGGVLDADYTAMARYDPDGGATSLAQWVRTGAALPDPVDTSLALGGRNVHTLVFRTRRAARIDDYDAASGAGVEAVRKLGLRSALGVPISVAGRLWGVISVASSREEPLPADAEARLAGFTELVATAIANAQARLELRGFAEEQAAQRRVATLVARGAPPGEVFATVVEAVGRLLTVDHTILSRYDPDGLATVVGHWASTDPGRPLAIDLRVKLEGQNIHTGVFDTGRSARIDDYRAASGAFADVARDWQFRASVGVPIWVEERLWGVIIVGSRSGPLPAGTESRLTGFTELTATAIANADAQAALAASRARIVAAGDAARRRMERDLHDSAQQRLVSLALRLRAMQATPLEAGELSSQLDEVVAELTGAIDELREIASGLHPAVLAEGGLRPVLKTLARRSAVPVGLDVGVDGRLPEPVELAAYYVVAEALTNTAKHADASGVDVTVTAGEGVLRVAVRDDGRGGADLTAGSGLVGLTDRVEALGGRLWMHSPPGAGTTVQVIIPLTASGSPRLRAAGTSPPSGPGPARPAEPNRADKA